MIATTVDPIGVFIGLISLPLSIFMRRNRARLFGDRERLSRSTRWNDRRVTFIQNFPWIFVGVVGLCLVVTNLIGLVMRLF